MRYNQVKYIKHLMYSFIVKSHLHFGDAKSRSYREYSKNTKDCYSLLSAVQGSLDFKLTIFF